MNNVVTRFPPSPTGFMHIGNARTALFNWLYAKANNGKMLFRIEDTDRKRHSEEAVEAIIHGLKWLGLDWDGEIVSQFERQARHVEVAEQLLAAGKAYKCYCTPEELEAMRETSKAEGRATLYDRRWRDRDASEAPADRPCVIRIKAPLDGIVKIVDQVQGNVSLNAEQIDDFVILRADGSPTYMLSVVVDDYDMGVTHVIRGDDHLNNAFRQNVIYTAMNWDLPVYAHLPLIHGPDGGKFSKRHGATSVEEYRNMGYLPEAMRNYLLRLGWAHGDDEIISTEQAIEWFDLSGVGKSPARFDFDKLESLNAHYIREADPERLIELCGPLYKDRHGIEITETSKKQILACADELKSRAKTLLQFTDESAFFGKSVPLDFDENAKALIEGNQDILSEIQARLGTLEEFSKEDVMACCKDIAKDMADSKLGKVGMPLRAALTGRTASPSVFHVAETLGQAETLQRVKAALH